MDETPLTYEGEEPLHPVSPPAPSDSPQGGHAGLAGTLLGVAILMGLSNMLVIPASGYIFMSNQSWWFLFMLGSLGGEIGLLAIAVVLGKGAVWIRMPAVLCLALVWITCLFVPAIWTEPDFAGVMGTLGMFYCCFPLIFLSAQMPLWLCRILLRWRIEPPGPNDSHPQPQLTIAGIFSFTTLVAISAALVNLAPHVAVGRDETVSLWPEIAPGLGTAFLYSLLSTVPFAAMVLRPRSGWMAAGLVVLWGIVLFGAAWLQYRRGYWESFPEAAVQVASATLYMTVPLFLLRLWKYRLRWGRK